MAGKIENFFIVNAPAGSGKTTAIKTKINEIASKHPKDNILCITYTNRAADELSRDFNSSSIYISTIHSFLHSFMKQYFSHEEIITLYFEVYGKEIQKRIINSEKNDSITDSNERYIDKNGDLSIDYIKKNLKKLYYNESSFNSLYYGGLCHDDLISFSNIVFIKYPIIQTRIASKFHHIFIDEYQDTTSNVLNIFYESLKGKKTALYLFGDKMQRIYKNYDGKFEERFEEFDYSYALDTNYRSIPQIIDILNKIYNDSSFEQKSSEEMKNMQPDFLPRIIICNNVKKKILQLNEENPSSLNLYLLNSSRFQAIGCMTLFNYYTNMERYSYGKNYSAIDILIDNSRDNPDSLMKLIFMILSINDDFLNSRYGVIIKKIKKEQSILNIKNWSLTNHNDKIKLHKILNSLSIILRSSDTSIKDILNYLKKYIPKSAPSIDAIFEEADYSEVTKTHIIEAVKLYNYLKDPKVSTQHGVKGESHDEVIFIADQSNKNPVVHMYIFFDLWTNFDFSLSELEEFYYLYSSDLIKISKEIGLKFNALNKNNFAPIKPTLVIAASDMITKFKTQYLFSTLCLSNYELFINNPTITNAKACFKETTIYGILSAYKLFYVGCSRSRKNLTILLDRTKIIGNEDRQINKFKYLGFQVLHDE